MVTKEKAFDLNQISPFKVVFPELSKAEFETAMLFSLGLSKKEISWIRNVSYPTVRDILQETKKKMDFYSLNNLISMFQVRLVIFALQQCVVVRSQETKK